MAKFRPIRKLGTGLERWKDEKTGKGRRKMGLLTPRKIRKSGKTHSKREKKEKNLERERFFLQGNAFLSIPVQANFFQHTSLDQCCALCLFGLTCQRFGMVWDARDLVGMHKFHFLVYYCLLCQFCNLLFLGVGVSHCSPFLGALHHSAGA